MEKDNRYKKDLHFPSFFSGYCPRNIEPDTNQIKYMVAWTPNFGYKMAWLAIRNTTPQDIIQKLYLPDMQTINWDVAMDRIYEKDDPIIITPRIHTWCFVVGRYLYDLGSYSDDLTKLKNRIVEFSNVFEEVQAFATHRVSEYHHWLRAKNGKVDRCFAYVGESGRILCNEGEITDEEKQFPWDKLETFQWFPKEQDVMIIAGKWSINPTLIQSKDPSDKLCYIGTIPSL